MIILCQAAKSRNEGCDAVSWYVALGPWVGASYGKTSVQITKSFGAFMVTHMAGGSWALAGCLMGCSGEATAENMEKLVSSPLAKAGPEEPLSDRNLFSYYGEASTPAPEDMVELEAPGNFAGDQSRATYVGGGDVKRMKKAGRTSPLRRSTLEAQGDSPRSKDERGAGTQVPR